MIRKPAPIVLLALVLTAAHAASAEEEESVETEVAVSVVPIRQATLRGYVTGYGTVELAPAQGGQPAAAAKVASPQPGVIVETLCEEGQHVEKGAPLFRLDSRIAELAVQKAKQALALAQQNSERQEKLVKIQGTSQKSVIEAESQLATAKSEVATAETQLDLTRIAAPFSGSVMKVNVRVGEAVDLTTVLAEIVDLDRRVVAVRVPSVEATTMKGGLVAEVTVSAQAKPVTGTVSYVSPQVDSASDTVLVRVTVPKDSGLRPGQFASVRIVSEERKDKLAVPVESVVKDEDAGTVISIVDGGKATRKAVKTGLRDGALVEIEGEGLREGQSVVTAGAYGLPKETKVRVVEAEKK
jgi:membrane fusion protein, multidrug efflux system